MQMPIVLNDGGIKSPGPSINAIAKEMGERLDGMQYNELNGRKCDVWFRVCAL